MHDTYIYMTLPDNYKTGNKKMDEKILKSIIRAGGYKITEGGKFYHSSEWEGPYNKFGVAKEEDRTYNDGIVFQSKKEMERWDYLKKILMAGEIEDLERQVSYLLMDGFISEQYGRIQPITYVADIRYKNISFRRDYPGKIVVEDVKGVRTSDYKLKRKLFLNKYPDIPFFEV